MKVCVNSTVFKEMKQSIYVWKVSFKKTNIQKIWKKWFLTNHPLPHQTSTFLLKNYVKVILSVLLSESTLIQSCIMRYIASSFFNNKHFSLMPKALPCPTTSKLRAKKKNQRIPKWFQRYNLQWFLLLFFYLGFC